MFAARIKKLCLSKRPSGPRGICFLGAKIFKMTFFNPTNVFYILFDSSR